MAAASNLATTIFIFSLLLSSFSPLSSACDPCRPKPKPWTPPPASPFCPRDTLKLGACVDLLGGVVNLVIGSPPSGDKCCPLLQANVLGINLDVPITLSLLISACGKSVPPGFLCG
ncbi:hypothetical protein CsSME_00049010 [Camellia sinensis var. sinensis]